MFPLLVGGENFKINDKEFHFVIMEKLGTPLQEYFEDTMSLSTVCHLGMKILDSLEKLHEMGMVHNDLKLENILIGDSNG